MPVSSLFGYVEYTGNPIHRVGQLDTWDDLVPPLITGWTSTHVTGATLGWGSFTYGNCPSQPNGVGCNTDTGTLGHQERLSRDAAVNMTTAPGTWLWFWMYHTATASHLDSLQVQVSTDNGLSWLNVGAALTVYSAALGAGWKSHCVDLSAYAGETSLLIGFLATANHTNYISIDSVDLGGSDQSDLVGSYVETGDGAVQTDSVVTYVEFEGDAFDDPGSPGAGESWVSMLLGYAEISEFTSMEGAWDASAYTHTATWTMQHPMLGTWDAVSATPIADWSFTPHGEWYVSSTTPDAPWVIDKYVPVSSAPLCRVCKTAVPPTRVHTTQLSPGRTALVRTRALNPVRQPRGR